MAKNFQKIKNGINLSPALAPASPEEGDLYYNATEGLQLRTAAGWVSPGSGSGSGELNFVDNPNDVNQNWFASAGTGDIAVTTSNNDAENPLEGIMRTSIKFTSSTSGTKFIYTRFKVPDTLLTAKEKFEWYQKTISGFVADQWTVELWWNDNAAYSGTYTEIPLRNDISGVSAIPAITGRYYNQWTGIAAAQYLELRFQRVSGSGAASFTVTNVIAGPGVNTIDQSDQSPAMSGSIIPYSGPTTGFSSIGSDGTTLLIKNGWALCNGASISQSVYSQLFANLSTTWNTAARQDGVGGNYVAPSAGFFRIPDLRGVFLRGVGTSVRTNGTASVVRTLAQFSNDSTSANGLTVSSTTSINNTNLAHTHSGTTLTFSGTTSNQNVDHSHTFSGTTSIEAGPNEPWYSNGVAIQAYGTSSPSGAPMYQDDESHVHTYSGTTSGMNTSHSHTYSGNVAGSTGGASVSMDHAHTASTTSTPASADAETAPRHTSLNYLIKLYDAQSLNVLNSTATSPFKAGFVTAGAMSTAPAGWLDCGGQAVSRTTYAELFTAIGTTYGSGDGSTTFNVPDLRGRVIAGKDDLGGTLASRITNAIAGFIGSTLGASGGSQSMQAHQHAATGLTNSTSTTTASSTGGGNTGTVSADHTHNFSGSTGSGSNSAWVIGVIPSSGSVAWPNHVPTRGGTLSGNTGDGSYPGQDHTHSFSGTTGGINTNHSHSIPALSIPSLTVAAQTISGSVQSTGAGASQNVQPTLILNYFIKAFNDTIDVTGFNVASQTTTGFMTNSDQTIGGVKSFPDGIIVPFIATGAPNIVTTTGTLSTYGLTLANSATPITLNLVTAVGQDGKQMTIKNINAGVVTVDPSGAETIDGASTRLLNQYDSLIIVAYAGQWYIL